MFRCPLCARRMAEEDECPRCGCSLAEVQRVRQAAAIAVSHARYLLAQGDRREALAWAERSFQLDPAAGGAPVAFLAASCSGLTPDALRWYRLARGE
ncbi:MAG: hypothetical protein GF331_18745 [Chitinivibrionales bacterium]|nr:hypothetical protein [Chitinivibrionales bacterium]